jgi:hypothetical protein
MPFLNYFRDLIRVPDLSEVTHHVGITKYPLEAGVVSRFGAAKDKSGRLEKNVFHVFIRK